MTFSKTLHPTDYALFGYYTYLFDSLKDTLPCIVNHFHRRWEYGMALAFLQSVGGPEKIKTVLDVGGAGSLFPPMAALCGYEVMLIDPSPCVAFAEEQNKILGIDIQWYQGTFPDDDTGWSADAVVSISTIEHVEEDQRFAEALGSAAQKYVFLTTDFSMTGEPHSPDHLRTYSPERLEQIFGKGGDYVDNGAYVFGYNFASIAKARPGVSDD